MDDIDDTLYEVEQALNEVATKGTDALCFARRWLRSLENDVTRMTSSERSKYHALWRRIGTILKDGVATNSVTLEAAVA